MSVIDDRTDNIGLPLPNENNELQDDVFRLREAFESLDTFISALNDITAQFAGPVTLDCDSLTKHGFYATTDTTVNGPPGYTMADGDGVIHIKKLADTLASDSQIYLSKSGRVWLRHKTDLLWGSYIDIWTSESLPKQSSATDVTAGRLLQVGSFGIGSGSVNAGSTNCNSLALGSFQYYETTETAAAALNLPSLGGTGSTARHWQVFTQGTDTLRTQIATEVKGVGTTKGRMFSRVLDGTWTTWGEKATQSSIDALTARMSEIESIALAGL